jgi:hypothetical protein
METDMKAEPAMRVFWTFFFLSSAVLLVFYLGPVVAETAFELTHARKKVKIAAHDGQHEAVPPGYSTARTGSMHDFDYFQGGWTTRQRRLKTRGVGGNEWEEFPGTLCMSLYLGGMATVDELYFPTKGSAGLTLRTFDPEKRQWSIYWVSSITGKLDPMPVLGGFEGDHGEFYAEDQDNGRPIKVRYSWRKLDHDHARWEQAFSYDNRTWETNWTADFSRTDPATACENGRPKR